MDIFVPELILEDNDLALPQETTEIQKFYAGTTIFITGATGFIGKLLLEKLLRTCPEISKIYILLRLNSYHNCERRLADLFETPVFDFIMRTQPEAVAKVEFIRGDMILKNMGLNAEEEEKLISEVDIIFNCASTTLTDDNLNKSTMVNVSAVKYLLGICKKMKHLKAFVHLSSVYSNCPKNVLEEEFSKPFISNKALIEFVETLDPNYMHWKPISLGKWPNNHLFTKAIGEDVIKTEGKSLPVTIIRPSIVISTVKQPFPGWSDNVNGPTGIIMTVYLGLTKSILAKKENTADIVPADHVVSLMIAAAWDVAHSKFLNENEEIVRSDESIPIYNLPSWKSNQITWGKFFELTHKYGKKLPSIHSLAHPWRVVHDNANLHMYIVFFLHYLPAYFFDCVIYYLQSDSKYLTYFSKIDSLLENLSFYSMNSWMIKSSNTRELWQKMSSQDQHVFDFDADNINWEMYFYTYIRGMRTYILKDGLASLEDARGIYLRKMIRMIASILLLLVIIIFIIIW